MNLHLLPSSESKSDWGHWCAIYYLEHWLIAPQVAVELPVKREQNVQSPSLCGSWQHREPTAVN